MAEKIVLKNGTLTYFPSFLNEKEIAIYTQFITEKIQFEQGEISIFGKKHPIPRLESFHSKENQTYSYSGKVLAAKPFTNELNLLCERIENTVKSNFNCVLINYYRDGLDSNGWHADNEKELGENPVIASLSLGETRRFDLKHQFEAEKFSILLHSGDLLLMDNQIQKFYKHQIAKSKKIMNPRINLTFRWIY